MNKIVGFILNLVATILLVVLSPVGILSSVIVTWWNKTFNSALGLLDEQQENIAIAKDVVGNLIFSPLFNVLFITKQSKHRFGVFPQTISYVLGANEHTGTLTSTGIYMVMILDAIESQHCHKAFLSYEKKKPCS